jgi:hypothetical protein
MTTKEPNKATEKKLTLAKQTLKDLAPSARQAKGLKGGKSGNGCRADNCTLHAIPVEHTTVTGSRRCCASRPSVSRTRATMTSTSLGEEWALLRRHCPTGGIRVTGYATPEERLRTIRGGTRASTGDSRLP